MTEPVSPDTGTGGTGTRPDTGRPRPDDGAPGASSPAPPPLPDLSEVDLETLRTLDHPVLAEMVGELRERAERPREMLWGFTNAF
ncbi:FxSxx-COOH cyclophane-containing RiPP peptide [Streptomyces sp. 8L]|uniref:FxSxx-COOH cyclophane-containing RiPP peptide n=1 Tax=Streptomyces sp. 8L TaxID=2877242 RepID=UPI001CD43F7F|nr:FxSxx-COOH cyclophane-containing RiPP peptide [Streptomyces sp. 8L]MCA1223738.1 FXSXX-COOH protein [Streptomyces sp. 8L]